MLPPAALVMCMVVLSVFATFVCGLHWYTIDRPPRRTLSLPPWIDCTEGASTILTMCRETCEVTYPDDNPKNIKSYKACMKQCDADYRTNYNSCSATYCPGTCPKI